MLEESISIRLDFVAEVESFDEQTGKLVQRIRLRPDRYERVQYEGDWAWFDKVDSVLFPEHILNRAIAQLEGHSGTFETPDVTDIEKHIDIRRDSIRQQLTTKQVPTTVSNRSQDALQELDGESSEFVILSVDMVGSTRRAFASDDSDFADLLVALQHELSETIALFHGHVLNFGGDGLVAFFAAPSFIVKHDLAFGCAMAIRRLINEALNPGLVEQQFEPIQIRIGIESGKAQIRTIGSDKTKRQKDLLGQVLNLASKLQGQAKPGEILLGPNAEKHLHTLYRARCEKIELGPDWLYTNSDGSALAVFKVEDTGLAT